MSNLFENVIVYTDIHYGLRHNSKEHNEDCLDFTKWLIEQAKLKNCKTCIFLGDWHHHRSNINLLTLDYTMKSLRLLNNYFDKIYILVGNHDLFYREKRDVHSLIVGTEFSNITLIDKPVILGDVGLVPWLVEEDEWKGVAKMKTKYIFGHLELPGFNMNANVKMPDHGQLNAQHFVHQDHVFSGHFHMRQTKGKVTYIGNPFGHNYADVWDFERGAMYLEWGGEPQFLNYTNGPRFISVPLSSLVENQELYLKPKTYLQVILDMDISYEEATMIRETLIHDYDVRELKLIKNPNQEILDIDVSPSMYKTVDQIVLEKITSIESDTFDTKKLIEIYNNL